MAKNSRKLFHVRFICKINIFNQLRVKNMAFEKVKFNYTHIFIYIRNCFILYFGMAIMAKNSRKLFVTRLSDKSKKI